MAARTASNKEGAAPGTTPARLRLSGKEYLARGKRGIAYTAMLGGRKVLIKEFNPSADVNTIAHEAEMLKIANTRSVGPLFIALQDGALIREFVDGEEIGDWLEGARKDAIKRVLAEIVEQCRALDELGVNKLEMTHPHKHILVRKGEPVFIDFDRARYTQKPKNVTQVCQWLTNKEMGTKLEGKGITLPRESMLAHARTYKQGYGAAAYKRILETIHNA